jgi:hypothetical protein
MSGIDQKGVIDAELARIMRESPYAISRTEAIHRLISERERTMTADQALAKVENWARSRAAGNLNLVEYYKDRDPVMYARKIGAMDAESSLAEAIAALRRNIRMTDRPCAETETDLIARLLNYEIDGTGLRREAAEEIIRLAADLAAARFALDAARSHCVSWQGEPDEHSCAIHRAVISVIDRAINAGAKQ